MKRVAAAINNFFFRPESPKALAAVRIAAGLVLLFEVGRHWLSAVELYSTAGVPYPLFPGNVAGLPIPGRWATAALASLHIASLLTLVLGWFTRTSAAIACFLCLWLWPLDAAGTMTKYSVLGIHLLGLLACSGAGAIWSTDAMTGTGERLVSPWPRRLMQFLACSVYLGAAMTKLKLPSFSNGDLLTFSLLDEHWGSGPGATGSETGGVSWGQLLVLHPQLLMLLSQLTLVIEITTPFLIWVPACRRAVLVVILSMHAGMGLLMNIGIFSPIMATLLFSFLEGSDFILFESWLGRIKRWRSAGKTPVAAGPTAAPADVGPAPLRNFLSWAGLVLTWTAVGTLFLWWHDGAEVFGNRPVSRLQEISRKEAESRILEQPPVQNEDYVHRIELGTRFGGNQTFGLRDRFPVGETIYAMLQTIPGHPAMKVEGILFEPRGHEIRRATIALDPSANYSVLAFRLADDFTPGDYRLVIQADSAEIWQRQVRVVKAR